MPPPLAGPLGCLLSLCVSGKTPGIRPIAGGSAGTSCSQLLSLGPARQSQQNRPLKQYQNSLFPSQHGRAFPPSRREINQIRKWGRRVEGDQGRKRESPMRAAPEMCLRPSLGGPVAMTLRGGSAFVCACVVCVFICYLCS